MTKIFSIIFLFFTATQLLMGQEVNSKAYDLMLSAMLSHNVEEISVKEASHISNAVFIDSREKNEFEVSHIAGARWLGYENANLESLNDLEKDATLIIYCSVGYRSEKITKQLNARGYKNVKNLYGGIFEWVNQGKEVVNKKGEKTKKIHAYNRMWGVWLNKGEKVYE